MIEGKISFEPDFLERIVSLILRDRNLLLRVSSDFKPEIARNPLISLILASCYNVAATGADTSFETVKQEMIYLSPAVLKNKTLLPIAVKKLEELYAIELTDAPYLEKRVMEYVKHEAVKRILNEEANSLYVQGKYDEIADRILQASRPLGDLNEDLGVSFFASIDERVDKRLNPASQVFVPTGFPRIDELLDGGLHSGELGVILAPTNYGKSSVLVNLGYEALRLGKKILHYSLEISRTGLERRYDMRICEIDKKGLRNSPDTAKKLLKDFYAASTGDLIVKVYPTKGATPKTLMDHVRQVQLKFGWLPDMIIVDYGDIMRSDHRSGQDERFIQQDVFESLRGIAGKFEIPVWTASQANRKSMEKSIVGMIDISESFAKCQVSDVILGFMVDSFFVAKNREGRVGDVIPLKSDLDHMHIYEDESSEVKQVGIKITKESADDIVKKLKEAVTKGRQEKESNESV